jgi:hypothetical protein
MRAAENPRRFNRNTVTNQPKAEWEPQPKAHMGFVGRVGLEPTAKGL